MKNYYEELYKLTAEDIRALRNADAVAFDLYWHNGQRRSQIRAIKERKHTKDGFDETVYIPASAVVEDYVREDWDPERRYKCYKLLHHPQYNEYWKTVVSLLHAGDSLRVCWVRSTGNGYLESSLTTTDSGSALRDRLYQFTLAVEIHRAMKRGEKVMSFMLRHSTCPDNSAAMVRDDFGR
jgi:hypothetical protein